MSSITEHQQQELESLLQKREAELRAEVRAAKEATAARPTIQDRQVDDSAEIGEQRIRSGIEHVELQRDQEELRDIEHARERMVHGSYGECIDCGRPIRYERLHVQPTAARCIDCQTKWEKSHPAAPRYSA